MNLIVDIGNTLVKVAVFDGGRLVGEQSLQLLRSADLAALLGGGRASRAIVSSTRGPVGDVLTVVRERADYVLEFTPQTPVPIANAIPNATTAKNVNNDMIAVIKTDCSRTNKNTVGFFAIMRFQYHQIVLVPNPS